MIVFVLQMETLRSAERHGAPRPYLARLVPGCRCAIDRLFVKARKISDSRRGLSTIARPGDVFEARRWLWDGLRQRYYGGTLWLGVQLDGRLCRLTRDEAFNAVLMAGLGGVAEDRSDVAKRIVPDDICIGPAERPPLCLP